MKIEVLRANIADLAEVQPSAAAEFTKALDALVEQMKFLDFGIQNCHTSYNGTLDAKVVQADFEAARAKLLKAFD